MRPSWSPRRDASGIDSGARAGRDAVDGHADLGRIAPALRVADSGRAHRPSRARSCPAASRGRRRTTAELVRVRVTADPQHGSCSRSRPAAPRREPSSSARIVASSDEAQHVLHRQPQPQVDGDRQRCEDLGPAHCRHASSLARPNPIALRVGWFSVRWCRRSARAGCRHARHAWSPRRWRARSPSAG